MTKALKKTALLTIAGLGITLAAGGSVSWATYTQSDNENASVFASVFVGIAVAAFVGIGLVAFGEHHYNKNKKPAKR